MLKLSEDLTAEILSTLPVKSLTRFKSVSKDFNSCISDDPIFLQLHRLQSQKTPYLLSMEFSDKTNSSTTIHLSISSNQQNLISRFTKNIETNGRTITDLLPSHHHLVCIAGRDNIYILNPITEELLSLPPSSVPTGHCPAVGFGYLPSKKEYKVIKLTYLKPDFDDPNNWLIEPEILTITTPKNSGFRFSSWRVLEDYCPFAAEGPCVFVKGVLFWKKVCGEIFDKKILSFDLEEEKFSTLFVPPNIAETASEFCIKEIRGDLWLTGYPRKIFVMELWVLKDLESSLWMKRFSFDCRAIEREIPSKLMIRGGIEVEKMKLVDFRNEEEILFEVDDQEMRELMRYNVKTETWRSVFVKKNERVKFCYYTNGFL